MTLTIELPDVLAEQAADAGMSAAEFGRFAEAGAVTALATALGIARTNTEGTYSSPVGVKPSDIETDLAVTEKGLADIDAGRTVSIEEASARADAALDAFIERRRNERSAGIQGTGT